MPEETLPSRPIEAYQALIDQLVNETSRGLSERLVTQQGIFSNAPTEQASNALVQSLSREQRETLVHMLHQERTGAIHDVLAVLTWWIVTRGLGFTHHGEPMPVELSGMGLHGDYAGRQNGWEWPEGGDHGGA